ncbi:MAG TPA: TetR/AcrR family transcriptional regulator [Gammaproteobacteria bacterium]|nr:TetR/AcrR family transcriptional regulator [Gammaproteobacteria bacterium]
MARHKTFDEREALDAAMHEFWLRGYEGTSLQDLETAMGLTRTSIYNAFGNKRELFNRVLEHYQQTVMAALLAELDSGAGLKTGVERMLNRMIDLHFSEETPGGCLVVLSVLEREQHDATSTRALEQTMAAMQKGLQQRIAKAQQTGEIDAGQDARALALSIVNTMAGMMVLGKAGFSKTALRQVARNAVRLLQC